MAEDAILSKREHLRAADVKGAADKTCYGGNAVLLAGFRVFTPAATRGGLLRVTLSIAKSVFLEP